MGELVFLFEPAGSQPVKHQLKLSLVEHQERLHVVLDARGAPLVPAALAALLRDLADDVEAGSLRAEAVFHLDALNGLGEKV